MRVIILAVLLIASFSTVAQKDNDKNPAEILIDHLNNIELKLRQEQSNTDSLEQGQGHQCSLEISFRKEQVADATQVLNRASEHLGKCTESKAQTTADLSNINQYNLDIVKFLTNSRRGRQQEKKLFDSRKQSIEQAIKAIDGAFAIVAEFANSKAAFIEVSKQINVVFRAAAKSGFGGEFAQILPAFVELSGDGKVSATSIDQIKSLLEALRTKLRNTLNQLNAGENSAMTSYNKFQLILTDLLRTIKKSEKDIRIYLSSLRKCIVQQGDLIGVSSQKKLRNSKILRLAEKMCKSFKTEFVSSTKGRSDELDLIEKLRSFIKSKAQEFAATEAFHA